MLLFLLASSFIPTYSRRLSSYYHDRNGDRHNDEQISGLERDNEECYIFSNYTSEKNLNKDVDVVALNITYYYELVYNRDEDPMPIVEEIKPSIGNAVGVSIVTNDCDSQGIDESVEVAIRIDYDFLDILQGMCISFSMTLKSHEVLYSTSQYIPKQNTLDNMDCQMVSTQQNSKHACNVFLGTMTILFANMDDSQEGFDWIVIRDTRMLFFSIIRNVMESGDLSSKYPEVTYITLQHESKNRSTEDESLQEKNGFESIGTGQELPLFGKFLLAGSGCLLVTGAAFAAYRKMKQRLESKSNK